MLLKLQPDDPAFNNKMMEKNFKRIKEQINEASQAKKQELADDPIIIAIIDTGCFSSHPQLEGMILHDESIAPGNNPNEDDENHGTLVAGVIWRYAGQIIDGFKGNKSVVKLINIKVGNVSGGEGFEKALQAIYKWEEENKRKVDVITTSLGLSKDKHKSERKAMNDLNVALTELSTKRVIMAAASNEGKTNPQTVFWPATNGFVLGINAIDDKGNPTNFASQGDGIDFAFPGKQIASTSRPPNSEEKKSGNIISRPGTTDEWWAINQDGTSFAAPHCAAAVAIVLTYIHIGLGKKARTTITNTEYMKGLFMRVAETQRDNRMGYGFSEFAKLNLDGVKDFLIDDGLLNLEDLD